MHHDMCIMTQVSLFVNSVMQAVSHALQHVHHGGTCSKAVLTFLMQLITDHTCIAFPHPGAAKQLAGPAQVGQQGWGGLKARQGGG